MDPTHRFRAYAATGGETRSLGDLFRDLSTDASRLIRQEAALARTEMRQNLRALMRDLGGVVIWGVVAVVGGLALVAFLVALLGDLLESYWLGALLVGALFALVGGGMALGAVRRLRNQQVKPDETLSSLRETGAWAQAEVAELRATLAGGAAGRTDGRGRAAVLRGPTPPRRALPPEEEREIGVEKRGAEKKGGPEEEQGFVKRLWHEVQEDDVLGQAAKVAYFAFLSLPPAILVVFGLTGFFGREGTAQWMTEQLQGFLPEEAQGIIQGFVQQVAEQQAPGPFSIGLVLALWAASTVFVALADALNKAYDVEEDRSWLKLRGVAVGVMLVFALLFLAATVALIAGPEIAGALALGALWEYLFWPLAFLFVVAAFWVIYYFLPNRDQSLEKGIILRGAVIGALVWVLATAAFRLYIANFGTYTETYGIIGAFIVLLLWMYVTGVAILLGGEINSEIRW